MILNILNIIFLIMGVLFVMLGMTNDKLGRHEAADVDDLVALVFFCILLFEIMGGGMIL